MSEAKSVLSAEEMAEPAGEGMVRVTFLPEGKTVEFEFDTATGE